MNTKYEPHIRDELVGFVLTPDEERLIRWVGDLDRWTAETLAGLLRKAQGRPPREQPRPEWIDHAGTLPHGRYGVSCGRCSRIIAQGRNAHVLDADTTRAAKMKHRCGGHR